MSPTHTHTHSHTRTHTEYIHKGLLWGSYVTRTNKSNYLKHRVVSHILLNHGIHTIAHIRTCTRTRTRTRTRTHTHTRSQPILAPFEGLLWGVMCANFVLAGFLMWLLEAGTENPDYGDPWEGVRLCCSVLQCVAVCFSVFQCVSVCCSVWQVAAVCCSILQCTKNLLQYHAV